MILRSVKMQHLKTNPDGGHLQTIANNTPYLRTSTLQLLALKLPGW